MDSNFVGFCERNKLSTFCCLKDPLDWDTLSVPAAESAGQRGRDGRRGGEKKCAACKRALTTQRKGGSTRGKMGTNTLKWKGKKASSFYLHHFSSATIFFSHGVLILGRGHTRQIHPPQRKKKPRTHFSLKKKKVP